VSWSVTCIAPWATAHDSINALELPEGINCDNLPAEVVSKYRGQLSSGKQTAKLLLRGVSGPKVEVQITSHIGGTLHVGDWEDGDFITVTVRQLGRLKP